MANYVTLMEAVSKAREESRTADRFAREMRKRVIEAERALVDWLVEQSASEAGQEGRDDLPTD